MFIEHVINKYVEESCAGDNFHCAAEKRCITENKRCDGYIDCYQDAADEVGCRKD